MSVHEDAVRYLKDKDGYKRIMQEIYKKYKRLGKLSGSFTLKNLTKEEGQILAPLDYNFYNAPEAKVSIKRFVENFSKGKFQDIEFVEVLKLYIGKELKTDKEIREEKSIKKNKFFAELIQEMDNTRAGIWLKQTIMSKGKGYITIIKQYESYEGEDKLDKLHAILKNLLKGVNALSYNPKEGELIPIFASKIARDPHFFDLDNFQGKLLLYAICQHLNMPYVESAEGQAEILYYAGLLKDDVSNYTFTFGLKAYSKESELKHIYDFSMQGEPLVLTLWNISKVDKFVCNKNKLFIFENPSVFSEVIKKVKDLNSSMVCTSGQLNLSSLILLDKTVPYAQEIYYAGDFDPEGIGIADKLKERYKEKLKLWRFTIEDYRKVLSSKNISDSSMVKLDGIKTEELKILAEEIKISKKAAYQEMLIEEYVRDINGIIKVR